MLINLRELRMVQELIRSGKVLKIDMKESGENNIITGRICQDQLGEERIEDGTISYINPLIIKSVSINVFDKTRGGYIGETWINTNEIDKASEFNL